ncbi:glycoside hydrolase family 43 protein [Streptomyces sp. NPDC006367]|uniref:glycoside hydrolase family 43 protein n=1 Tax=unclassified Streptomyces TaxID=2593676 RepID=UPI0033B22562
MSVGLIHNPVLPGFHPDPSIVRVDDTYYLVTSTFEWLPGVPVHRSADLAHWELAGHLLDRPDLVDLRGVADSAGVWAPSLSYHDGLFWLAYSVVRTVGHPFKDVDNFLITAPSIEGPWSAPVFLNSSGFDPSLFHDEDGRTWLLNIEWDPRDGRPSFAGILLQEYDRVRRRLVGRPRTVLTHEDLVEGPHVYRRDGWYYLMLAHGGTGWNHGILMARSRSLTGPYELDPDGDLMTTRHTRTAPLLKAGHGELVETPDGEWYVAHLASRPVATEGGPRSILGRETCIEKITWPRDGWPRLEHGGTEPRLTVAGPSRPTATGPSRPAAVGPSPSAASGRARRTVPERDDFDAPVLHSSWCTLRVPADPSWLSLTDRPGHLRLSGRQSLHSRFEQSLVARRLRSLRCEARTVMDFHPDHFTQSAGLVCWYDTSTYFYLRVTHDETRGRVLGLVENDAGAYRERPETVIDVGTWPSLHLRARLDGAALTLSASPDGADWLGVGPVLDASRLSDDYGDVLRFTGAFVGLCAQDLGGTRTPAYFGHFALEDR